MEFDFFRDCKDPKYDSASNRNLAVLQNWAPRCAQTLRLKEGKTTTGKKITYLILTEAGEFRQGTWLNIVDHIGFLISRLFRRDDSYDLNKIVDVLCDNLPQLTNKKDEPTAYKEDQDLLKYERAVRSIIGRIHIYNSRHIHKISQEKIDRLRKLCMVDVDEPALKSLDSLLTLREREMPNAWASGWDWWVDVVEDKTQDGKSVSYVESTMTTKLGRLVNMIHSIFGFGTANLPKLADTFAKTLPKIGDLGQWYPDRDPNVRRRADAIHRENTKQGIQENYLESIKFLIGKINHYNKWHITKISQDTINTLRARVGLGS